MFFDLLRIIHIVFLALGLASAIAALILAMQWTKPIKKNSWPPSMILFSFVFTTNGLNMVWGDIRSIEFQSSMGRVFEPPVVVWFAQLFNRNEVFFSYVGLILAFCIGAAYVCYLKRASQFMNRAN